MPANAISRNWRTIVRNRIALYGHRNWIVVADFAFPAYTSSGIETVVVDDGLLPVLKYVARTISSSHHVRSTVFLDKELQFVDERDYPKVSVLTKQMRKVLGKGGACSIPHSEVIKRIAEVGKTFRILLIKTTERIPYSSVYIRLDCGYLNAQIDRRIRAAMRAEEKHLRARI